jgi:hypothetical protein
VRTIAGDTTSSGLTNGRKSEATFRYPCHIAVDEFDNIFVADYDNHCIRKVDNEGEIICEFLQNS